MKRIFYSLVIMLIAIGLCTSLLQAQMANLHGTDEEYRMGVHSGNKFRTTFFNDGTYGGRSSQPNQIAGEWPRNSGHLYLNDGNIFVGSEVIDNQGSLIHIVSENKSVNIGGSRGDQNPNTGEWWTFLPLAGFAEANSDRIAMVKGSAEWPNSWPAYWPDKSDDLSDPGWRNDNIDRNPSKAAWNGYFGKNVFNADEESYFVADDYMNREFDFYPDSTDLERKGLGLRIYVRGFQWAKAAVEDALFCLYDIENIGTYKHDKIVFGYKIGNNMGESATNPGQDYSDDNAAVDRELNLAYMWDNDNLGTGNWGPVGEMGGAFLESPGNPYDGIDNDNDGRTFSGPTISETLWQPKTLGLSDRIVLINYKTYKRTITTLADTLAKIGKDTLEVRYGANVFKFYDGKQLEEVGDNLVDDNLNGLIDENRGAEDAAGIFHFLYIVNGQGYKYIDFLSSDPTTNGMNNPMLDEARDDGIDNDGDWDPLFDDTGADGLLPGVSGYPGPDFGEGDGRCTSGEPHFDKTDIDETDMLGLTSFNLYEWSSLNQYDDERYWTAMRPGLFSSSLTSQNVELLYGSGYFPLVPGQRERISMAIIVGIDHGDLIRNKQYVAQAYNQNYNFSKSPFIPTVKALTGNNRVTLFWDNYAESSNDPITGYDFEGYKIYRSTDAGFNDGTPITDGFGSVIWNKPIVQFDLANNIYGFAQIATQGVQFWLGSDTGIRHYWTDTTAVNGVKYFYAVTSFDHGSYNPAGADILGIDPSECTKYVAISSSGEIEKGANVVVVRTEAPAAGYVPAELKDSLIVRGQNNTADGSVGFTIINSDSIKDNHTYKITFQQTLTRQNIDSTASFNLTDLTDNRQLLSNHPLDVGNEGLPIVDGFQLSFSSNPGTLGINSTLSGWSRPGIGIPAYDFKRYIPTPNTRPVRLIAGDFEIIFAEVGIDTSKPYSRGTEDLPAKPVNFTVINTTTNQKVPFAFRERHSTTGTEGQFSFNLQNRRSDEIIFMANPDSLIASWQVVFITSVATDTVIPKPGDVLTLKLRKPFLAHDTFEFTTIAPQIDQSLAKIDLDKIKVVPNPYIVTNSWEPQNPYANGRGERQLHFTHLPAKCTIKIFNIRGQLVDTIEHNNVISDGTEIWDMLSKDNLEIAYGIYIYHLKADGIGEKIGKFVVIK